MMARMAIGCLVNKSEEILLNIVKNRRIIKESASRRRAEFLIDYQGQIR
jgi:hypothetical protein